MKGSGCGHRQKLVGTVVTNKMNKTVIVRVERLLKHPIYRKYIQRQKKFAVHDENGRCAIGDLVEIVSTRPLSKTKRWAVTKILKQNTSSPPSA